MQFESFVRRVLRTGTVLVTAALTVGCAGIKSETANAAPPAQQIAALSSSSSTSSSLDPELMFQLLAGELAGQFGDIPAAVEHYNEAARLSDDPRVAERAVQIDVYAEDNVSGLQAARRWVELAPSSFEARQMLGLMLVRNGRTEEAMPHFEYLIERAPAAGGNGFMLIGASLAQEQDAAAALAAMQMLIERYPEDAMAHYAYANLALGAGQVSEALAAVNKTLALKPDMTEARVLHARASLAAGNKQAAVEGMRQTVEAAPDDAELRIAYAKMLVQAERYGMARAEFAKLLKLRPQNPDLLYTLGLLEMQQQRYAEAGEHFERLLNVGQRTDEARYYLGRVAEEQEHYDQATQWYGQVQKGQFYIDAQARIAVVLSKRGELAQARAHLQRARAAHNDIATIVQLYLAEGELLREAEQYEAGMELFSRGLSDYPGNTDLLYARALMAEELGRIDQLESDLRAILDTDPDNATALNALGFTLADRNERVHEALGYIKRAYEARPDDPAVIDSMGWVHFRLGNYDEAEQHLRRAFKLLPDGEIAGHLSELMWAQGQKKQALSVLREALNREPGHEYLLELRERYTQ